MTALEGLCALRRCWVPALALASIAIPAFAQSDVDAAKQLFERYQALEQAFDPAVADLFTDKAVIRVTRVYPDGQSRQVEIPGELYKLALRQSMDEAKRHGDSDRYSNVRYTRVDGRVRINAVRYSVWQHYKAPCSFLVGPGSNGQWRIDAATFETRVIPSAPSQR